MKKTTFFSRTVIDRLLKTCISAVSFVAFLVCSQPLLAQPCNIDCPGPFHVSVDMNCEAILFPDSIATTHCGEELKGFMILDGDTIASGNPIFIPSGTALTTYILVIADTSAMGVGNSCWTTFDLMDYLPPTISCTDTTLNCLEIINFMPVPVDNCDPDPIVQLIGSFEFDTCSDVINGGVIRHYLTFDANNGSDTCSQRIYFRRLGVDSIDYPLDTTLACDSMIITTNEGGVEGAPHPSQVGEPMIDTFGLWSDPVHACNLIVSFTDIEVPLPGGCHNGIKRKIFRTWSVTEWFCDGGDTTVTMGRILKLIDSVAPVITCPGDIIVGAGIHDCKATLNLPPASAVDNCCPDVDIAIRTPVGFMFSNGGVVTLPAGIHTITYFATDACFNRDSCNITVTVEDLSPPEPVCISRVSTGLTTSGLAKIFAKDLDKGSHDNCGPVYFKVLRMDDELVDGISGGSSHSSSEPFACGGVNGDDDDAVNNDSTQVGFEVLFDDYVKFCCEDIEQPVMVFFRVYDFLPDELIDGPIPRSYHQTILKGHFNDCMVEVTVQDKLPPRVVCAPEITVSCEFDFDLNNLSVHFGDVVAGKDNRDSIVIVDSVLYGDNNPRFVGYDGYGEDNCNVMVEEKDPQIEVKCNVGYIIRTWDITDDGGRTVWCTQQINIINPTPYEPLPNAFPSDTTITDQCELLDLVPAVTGEFDQSNDTECSQVIVTYEDQIFDAVPGVCFKILRRWTVVDWCQFNSSRQTGFWEGEQLIAVMNTIPPTITSSCLDREPIVSQDPNCGSEPVTLIATATDDCTPSASLKYSYAIDLHNNNTVDDTGNTNDASGDFELGVHRITWTVEDLCGNKTSCTFLFSILSGTKPVPFCQDMATVVDDNGIATIWVGDIDNKSAHPCGNEIFLSFSPDSELAFLEFTCDDLGDNPVNLYAIDVLGNFDFCTAIVNIQDNSRDICPDPLSSVTVGGTITTYDNEAVNGAAVYLDGAEIAPTVTNLTGEFAFYNMPMGGDYQVRPYNNDNALQSVNTLDLIHIQRHILGLEGLNSPYRMIAADANNDGEVDVLDLVTLQRVILGIDGSFNGNTSWRFINSLYQFGNENPLSQNFDEQHNIDNLSSNMQVNFVGVKIGDVNGSYQPAGIASSNVNGRSNRAIVLDLVQQASALELYASDAQRLMGMQLDLILPNADKIDYISSDILSFDASDYQIGKSGVVISWYDSHLIDVDTDRPLFTIHYKNDVNINSESAVAIRSVGDRVLESQAYSSLTDIKTIQIRSRSNSDFVEGYVLYQNTPNPFLSTTSIGFELAKSTMVNMAIYDISGKLIHQEENNLEQGYNELIVQKSDLDNAGIYYYQLSSEDFTATKKMILIE